MERVVGRLNEERLRLWDPPHLRRYFRPRTEHGDGRPTRGTSLEFEYPRLEALLAAGNDRAQSLIRLGAARLALQANDVLTSEWVDMIDAAEYGPVDTERLARVSSAVKAVTEAWIALDDGTDPGWVQRNILRSRRFALSSLQNAVEPLVFPLDAADAVYEAAKSLPDRRDVSSLEALAVDILGPERLRQQARSRFDPVRRRKSEQRRIPRGWEDCRRRGEPPAILAGIGLVAGAAGKIAASSPGRASPTTRRRSRANES
jgi:hypothetical protein